MIKQTLVLLFFLNLFAGCNSGEQAEALRQREGQLAEREKSVLLREEALAVREEALLQRVREMDSTARMDTTYLVNDTLVGTWAVRMTCTEATCPGSAVGDTKTESWQFAYQGTSLVVRAFANNTLVRVYTGKVIGNTIEMTGDPTGTPAAQMTVRLRIADDKHLEGNREILRENDCKIVFALQLEKT